MLFRSERGGWYKTKDGWISGKYVDRIDQRYIGILSNNANIRDIDLNIIYTAEQGDAIVIYPGEIDVNGIKITPVKHGQYKGYVQKGSYEIIK